MKVKMNEPTFSSRRDFLKTSTAAVVGGALAAPWAQPLAADAPEQRPARAPAATPLPPEVKSFITAKERQVRQSARKHGVEAMPEIGDYFNAAKRADLREASDIFASLRPLLCQPRDRKNESAFDAVASAATLEVQLALEQFLEGDPKFALACGRNIIQSIPRGSIYFGGTDPGRGLVTALCPSHEKADPFFTLTQNALANGQYLAYLREMYGARIHVPTEEDSQKAFQDYISDAQRRLEHDRDFPTEPKQIKPGEDVRMVEGRVQVSGQIAVMAINGRLARVIFDANPDVEFFVEESFPLEWMYPHLSPQGLIMKINREPPATLSWEQVDRDRAFWSRQQKALIGDWLKPETNVKEVCAFVERVFVGKDLSGFKGDPQFVRSDSACKTYSKLRSAIGGLYAWRLNDARQAPEKERLRKEADFAFRQAFALCPSSPEAVFRYINLLVGQDQIDDALQLAQTAAKVEPSNHQLADLIRELNRIKEQPGRNKSKRP